MYQQKPSKSLNPRGCIFASALFFLVIIGTYIGLRFWHSVAVPDFVHLPFINPWELRLTRLSGGFVDEKPVLWAFSYYKGTEWGRKVNRYQLDVIDPQSRKLIKRHHFENKIRSISDSEFDEFDLLGNQMFIASPTLGMQWRNLSTGNIEKTEQNLIQKFAQLRTGIGEVGGEYGVLKWRVLTTKDGLKFHYSPILDELYSDEEKNKQKSQESDEVFSQKGKISYKWKLSGDDIRKELILVKQFHSIFDDIYARDKKDFEQDLKRAEENERREAEYLRRQEEFLERLNPEQMEKRMNQLKEEQEKRKAKEDIRFQKEQKLVFYLKNRVFLNASLIYEDSTQCLILHTNEISKDARPLITYIRADEKYTAQWDASSLKILQNRYKTPFNPNDFSAVVSKNNQMMIFSNKFREAGIVGIDLKTSKILWEWMIL